KPIAPDYFATLKIPFVSGRDFNDSDKPGSPPVTIVNETFARQITASRLPLGQTVLIDDKPYQIVGLVKDAQLRSATEGPLPVAYVPFWQDETLLEARMCIRVAGDPAAALPMVRKAIASIDSDVPVTETMPLMDQVRGAYTDTRVAGAVLSCAALLALILSGMGLYGIVSYEVGRRTKEIGVRVAHGGSALRVTHGSRRATTKDENGLTHLCFVFNAIGSYFHRSEDLCQRYEAYQMDSGRCSEESRSTGS